MMAIILTAKVTQVDSMDSLIATVCMKFPEESVATVKRCLSEIRGIMGDSQTEEESKP